MGEPSVTPTESAEHVSIGENGAFILSPEALDAMDNVQPFEEPAEIEEATPAPEVPEPVATAPPTRTIKHNGVDVEITADREIEYLQKGYNYESKMAGLETERARLQGYSGLISAMDASPAIRQGVSKLLGYEPEPEQPQTPQFDDPIEQLKWEVRQETIKEIESRFIQPMQQQNQQTAHQNQIDSVKQQVQSDPQYNEVHTAIIEQIKTLPESLGREMYQRLDNDPRAYREMFDTTKARLKPTAETPQPQAVVPPTPIKRETKAPLLESGLNATAPAAQQAQTDHIKALEKRSRNGDFRATGELMALMA